MINTDTATDVISDRFYSQIFKINYSLKNLTNCFAFITVISTPVFHISFYPSTSYHLSGVGQSITPSIYILSDPHTCTWSSSVYV